MRTLLCLAVWSLFVVVSAPAQLSDSLSRSPDAGKWYRGSRTILFDLFHTRLDLQVDFEKQRMEGAAVLSLRPYFYPQRFLELDAKGMEIAGVFRLKNYTGGPSLAEVTREKLNYTYDGKAIQIDLENRYQRTDTLTLLIDYAVGKKAEDSTEVPYAEKGFYFINPDGKDPDSPVQLWTHGEPEAASRWFPTIDTPPIKFTQELYLKVGARFRTLSNGRLIGSVTHSDGTRTDHWKQSLPHSPYLAMVAVGEFSVSAETAEGGLELSYYVEQKYAPYAKAIFGRTPAMVQFFSGIFGVPFPWEKYAQVAVRNFVAGAMENTTATIHEEGIQSDSIALLDGNADGVIAHELAHHWFGNLVTCEEWGQLPLNESFANYAEFLWMEHFKGRDEADFLNHGELMSYLDEAGRKKEPLIRYYYQSSRDMFDNHSYAKGGRVLHMLRKLVGDDAFFESLKTYLNRHRFASVEIHHLRLAFEETVGQDLKWFFDQWFLKSGHPVLEVSQALNKESNKLLLRIAQVQDTTNVVYRLPLLVDIWDSQGKSTHRIWMEKSVQEFEFSVLGVPDLVIVDPEVQLLGEIRHLKETEGWINQYRRAEYVPLRGQAIDELLTRMDDERAVEVVKGALDDPFRAIRQKAVAGLFEYKGSDQGTVIQKLRKLSVSDPDPVVRATAVEVLATFAAKDRVAYLRERLEDPSRYVVSVALEALLKEDRQNAAKTAARFSGSSDEAILSAVAVYYATQAKGSHYKWFVEKLSGMRAQGKYNFVQVFAQYLLKAPEFEKKEGLSLIGAYARNSPSLRVRLGAFQALGLFYDRPEVLKVLKEIQVSEKSKEFAEMLKWYGAFE